VLTKTTKFLLIFRVRIISYKHLLFLRVPKHCYAIMKAIMLLYFPYPCEKCGGCGFVSGAIATTGLTLLMDK